MNVTNTRTHLPGYFIHGFFFLGTINNFTRLIIEYEFTQKLANVWEMGLAATRSIICHEISLKNCVGLL